MILFYFINRLLPYVPILGTWLQNIFLELFLKLGKNRLYFPMNQWKTFKKTHIFIYNQSRYFYPIFQNMRKNDFFFKIFILKRHYNSWNGKIIWIYIYLGIYVY